jgi:hypothetical protein
MRSSGLAPRLDFALMFHYSGHVLAVLCLSCIKFSKFVLVNAIQKSKCPPQPLFAQLCSSRSISNDCALPTSLKGTENPPLKMHITIFNIYT